MARTFILKSALLLFLRFYRCNHRPNTRCMIGFWRPGSWVGQKRERADNCYLTTVLRAPGMFVNY